MLFLEIFKKETPELQESRNGYKGFCDLNQWLNELNRIYVIVKGDKKQMGEGLYIT